ncbi:MAG: 16S rRNA (guanine(527)-N(7))-methyltransferase RsmG [Kiloniellaceae bacterium]
MSTAAFGLAADVSRETLARLERYAALLEKWNRAVNLVGRDSLADLWRRHMLDSAQLVPLLPPAPAGRARVVVDLGSGAGFPGLVLAILGAGAVHLVEADRRKAAFLRAAARETDTVVRVHNARIEAIPGFAADVVTARALAPLPRLIGYAAPFLRSGGAAGAGGVALFLKGRRVDEELTESVEKCHMQIERFPSRSDPGGQILRLRFLDMGEVGP